MAIYRGTGGSTSTTEQATIDAVNEDAATATTKAAEASASATAAATSASSASSSATSAASSASTATSSASNAATSAAQAATSAATSAAYSDTASTAATNAASSATTATTQASSATTSAANAASSETAAETAETNASNHSSDAQKSAYGAVDTLQTLSDSSTLYSARHYASKTSADKTAAAASATAAAASETAAAASETAAAASETAAAGSATAAATSATAAASSATSASGSATTATTKASEAATSATSASGSATTATTKASEAATSATNAATSETNAATSASAASTSATNAASSASSASSAQTAAEAAKDAALAALDNFDDRYLGVKTSDPTLDNDGNALVTGALYFNSTDDVMKVYDGSAWRAAYADLSGALLATNNLSDLASASAARTNLGVAIGTDVQAYSSVLAGTTASYTTAEETKLAGIETAATADQTAQEIATAIDADATAEATLKSALGLGTAAYTASTAYATAAQGTLADSAVQPSDNISTLTNDSGYITGVSVSGISDTTITTPADNEVLAYDSTTSKWINQTAAEAGLQPAGSYLTGNQTITLSGDVSGSGTTAITVTVADDSHNHVISNVDGLQTALDAKQALDADLTAIAGLSSADGNFIVGSATGWVAESGATARASLGLGSLATLSTVNASTITDNSVGAAELNVSGNGTTSQFLRSDGDGTFTWATPTDTNTTYSAGAGLDLSGTTFLVEADIREYTNAYIGGSGGEYIHYDGTNNLLRGYVNSGEKMRIDGSGNVHFDGDVIAYSTTISDERLKDNIVGIDDAVNKVSQLNGYTFTYKHDDKVSAGVIAQEVEKVLPQAVYEAELGLHTNDDGETYKLVNYDALHGLLIEAVKELTKRVEELENK